jgi:hypothetical protein
MINLNHPVLLAIVSLGLYGIVYFGIAAIFRIPEATGLIQKVQRFKRSGFNS